MVKESKLNQILEENENSDLKLSYSRISDFDKVGAIALIKRSAINNTGIQLGSLVDDILFNDEKYFKENYYIFDGSKPTATLGKICDIIIENYIEIPNEQKVLKIITLNNFWSNVKSEKVLDSKFNTDEFWSYLKCKFEESNKIVITTQEYNDALELIDILKEHKYSKSILFNKYENIYQLKFEFEYKTFKIRGILDIVSIDHKNKMIYFTDLKTGAKPANEFEDSFIKWRYYFQGTIYSLAFDEICKVLKLEGYKLAPFQFLYISKSDKLPLLYKMTDKWLKASIKGFSINKYRYRGLDELLENIRWCWDNKIFYPPNMILEEEEIEENNGIVELKDNFIEINE